jgi:phospholipid/cholesterol/gamma-HCH transport system substrate-binding protein
MDKSKRLEIKVGAFVFAGLLLLAVLLLQFSKSTSAFRGTYELRLHAANVGGIKPRAQVLLAGVQVGTVADIKLAPDTKSVTLFLNIYKNYVIYHDARFVIEQEGFLGDKYVSIIPTLNTDPSLTNHADVPCEEPFNLQEVARSAAGFIQHISETATNVNAAIAEIRRTVLSQQTLTNFAQAINNVRTVSEQALTMVGHLDQLVDTNREQVNLAVSNLVFFSRQLNDLAGSGDALLATNGAAITVAVNNLEASTVILTNVLGEVRAGKGLAGTILQNQELSSNVLAIAGNLSVTTSNLNREGLWGILWSHKPPKPSDTNSTPPAARSPK